MIGADGGEGLDRLNALPSTKGLMPKVEGSTPASLGKGQFGQVLLGRSEQGKRVAIKVMPHEDRKEGDSPLEAEASILAELSGREGFPEFLFHGPATISGVPSDVLVMELLGASLLERCWTSTSADPLCTQSAAIRSRVFNAAAVLRIGRMVLRSLETLAARNLVHNDLKPGNLLFGCYGTGREDQVHIIDFGGVTRGGEARDDCDVDDVLQTGQDFTCGGGTPLFASLAAMEGRPTRPVDDLVSP